MSNEQKWSGGAGSVSSARPGFDVSKLLAVIVEFGQGHEAFLFRDSDSGLVLQGYATADEAKKSGFGSATDVGCNLAMVTIVKEVLRSDKTYQGNGETGDANILCVPVLMKHVGKAALYIRFQGSDHFMSDADTRAVEMFGITLGKIIDLDNCNSEEQNTVSGIENEVVFDKTALVANARYIEPSDLSEVAKSIAIEINNSLTAIVAHTSAALRWMNKGEPDIHRAKHSLDRIAAAAFSAEGIISVYKSTGQGKRPEAELVDIRQAVICALDELEHEFLEFDISSECGLVGEEFVFAEPKQLHQALVNIISAALDGLKGLGPQKKLRILGEQHHHEFVIKISDDARPSVSNRDGAGPDNANYTGREIKLAIANTLARVQGGGLALSGFEESERAIKLSLPNTKRQRYFHFM